MTAKEILLRYRDARREAAEMERKITQLRLKYAAPAAIKYSDMPTAHDSNHDLSEFAAQLEELTNMCIDKYNKCLGIEIDVEMRLDRMSNQVEREILRHRYLDIDESYRLAHWRHVADCVHYSIRNVKRIHDGPALAHFPVD